MKITKVMKKVFVVFVTAILSVGCATAGEYSAQDHATAITAARQDALRQIIEYQRTGKITSVTETHFAQLKHDQVEVLSSGNLPDGVKEVSQNFDDANGVGTVILSYDGNRFEGQGISADIMRVSNQEGDKQDIGTSTEMVKATGLGAPPQSITNKAQRQILARRSAKVDAMRNLSELLRQVTIKSRSKRNMAVMTEDEVTATVNASLSRAKVVSEKILEGEMYEIVMEAPVSQ